MKFVRRILAFALALLLLVIPAMGCESYQAETNDSNTVAVIIDGEKYYMDEAKLYTYAAQYRLEDDYVFYILYYYGGYDAFWDADWSEALSEGVAELYQTKVLCKYAAANNITLTAEETAKIDAAIAEYKEDAGAAITYSGASDELVKKYFTENALANKVYCELIKDVDTNFDTAEFTRKNVEGVTVIALTEEPDETTEEETDPEEEETEETEYTGDPEEDETGEEETSEEDTTEATTEAGGEGPVDDEEQAPLMVGAENDGAIYGVVMDGAEAGENADESASETETETASETETTAEETTTEEETTAKETYSEETQNEKRTAALEDVLKRMEEGATVDEIVEAYRGDKFVTVSKISSTTIAPTDAVEEGKDKTSYKQNAWELKTGETTVCSYEGEEDTLVGYVLRCVNDDDPDLRKEAEDTELASRKVKLFNEKYAAIQAAVKEFHVYSEKVSSAIKYKGQIHDAMTITGDDVDDFYETSSEAETETDTESETAAESETETETEASTTVAE